jgi:hypothetical protein
MNWKLGIQFETSLKRTYEIEIKRDNQVFHESVFLLVKLSSLRIRTEYFIYDSFGAVFDDLHILVQSIFNVDIIVELNINHAFSVKHLLGFEKVFIRKILERSRQLITEVELNHLQQIIKDRFGDDVSLTVIKILFFNEFLV